MRHLNDILESIFDIEDKADQTIIDSIHKFIKDIYKASPYTIRDELVGGKYVVDTRGSVNVKNKHITTLTNGSFRWGEVGGAFDCSFCKSLTSLEGAPEEVGDGFYCNYCDSLMSLEGAPKVVGRGFDCDKCKSLISFEGTPEKVGGNFYCRGCTSIKDKTIYSKVGGKIYS